MKNYLFCALLALALLSGCIANPPTPGSNHTIPPVPSGNVSLEPEANLSSLMDMSENETASTVYIKTLGRNGEWLFPLQNHSGEFAEAGIYSSVFIKLNSSQLKTLGNDESLWITPYASDGKGILFNTILSKEINRCNLSAVRLLGKYYTMDYLKASPNFNNDDKWKITTVSESGCIKRVLIVQNGYFYNIEENESIQLFTNDGSLSAQFRNLGSTPELVVSASKPTPLTPPEANTTTNITNASAEVPISNPRFTVPYTQEFDINLTISYHDLQWDKQYHGKEAVNSSGFYVEFDPALPMVVNLSFISYYNQTNHSVVYWLIESDAASGLVKKLTTPIVYPHEEYYQPHLQSYVQPFIFFLQYIPFPGSERDERLITCMEHDQSVSTFCLGKEISRHELLLYHQDNITLDSKTYRLVDVPMDDPTSWLNLQSSTDFSSLWQNCSAKHPFSHVDGIYGPAGRAVILEQVNDFSYSEVNISNAVSLCVGDRFPVSDTKKILITGASLYSWRVFMHHFNFVYFDNESEFNDGVDGVILDWSTANGAPALKSVFIPSTHPYYAQLLG